jgi:hypothetical protein
MTGVGLVFELFTNVLIVFLYVVIVSCMTVLAVNVYDDYRTLIRNRKKKK